MYLNALTGKGVHVITVNDYLAKRDERMGQIFEIPWADNFWLLLTTWITISAATPITASI